MSSPMIWAVNKIILFLWSVSLSKKHLQFFYSGISDFIVSQCTSDQPQFPSLHCLHSFLNRPLTTSRILTSHPVQIISENIGKWRPGFTAKLRKKCTFTMNRLITTFLVCPIRWIRMTACSSTAGFHHGSCSSVKHFASIIMNVYIHHKHTVKTQLNR